MQPLRLPAPILAFLLLCPGCSTTGTTAGAEVGKTTWVINAPTPPPDTAADADAAVSPTDAELEALRTKAAYIRELARDVILPKLASAAAGAEARFKGVCSMGLRMGNLPPDAVPDADAMAFRNPDYWRGIMEMVPGNPLVSAMGPALLAAEGEFDRAARLARIITAFSDDESMAGSALHQLVLELNGLDQLLAASIQQGIALHDRGRYESALAHYRRLHEVMPRSAWLNYELFFTGIMRKCAPALPDNEEVRGVWTQAAAVIYDCDPLYPTQFSGRRGCDLAALKDRLELNGLLGKPPQDLKVMFAGYADLALKLGDLPVASHLYWLLLGVNDLPEPPVEARLARFLYCLHKMGVSGIEENFKEDWADAFSRLDVELDIHRRQ